jgi:hypothetical protein
MFFLWSISQRNKRNDEWPKLIAVPSVSSRPFLFRLEAIEVFDHALELPSML